MTSSDPWDFSQYAQKPAPGAPPPPPQSGYVPPSGPNPGGFGGFDTPSPAGSGDLSIGRPPVHWLAICAAVVVVGGLIAWLLGAAPPFAVVAWVLSGPIAIGLLAAFTSFDTRARARSTYASPDWVKPAYVICLVLCGLAVIGSAIRIAFWVGRL